MLRSPHELFIPGQVAACKGITLDGGAPFFDHSDYFQSTFPVDHPLHDRSHYAILVTGTLTTFGDATDLVLAAAADVIVRGNLDVRGVGSNLVIQSDSSVFLEGFATVPNGNVTLFGGYAWSGLALLPLLSGETATTGKSTRPTDGNSVTVYEASRVNTRAAGSTIDINPSGLSMFAKGDLQIGPNGLQPLDMDAVGVLTINHSGIATDLFVAAFAGISRLMTLQGVYRLAMNTTGTAQEVPVPQRFIDLGILPTDFVASLTPSVTHPGQKSYIVPAGAPKLNGSFGPAGPYAVMQGQGSARLVNLFALEGSFRFEVSTQGLFAQIDGGLRLSPFGLVNALGYFEITSAGLVAAASLDLHNPALEAVGIDFEADVEMVINTTSQTKTITFLSDNIGGVPIIASPGEIDIKAAGLLAVRVPGTDIELGRIDGVFSLDTSAERVTVFANGDLELGPRGLHVFDLSATGVFALTNDGFAADLRVHAEGGVASLAELRGDLRLVANLTGIDQEVPVPQRFIDEGFLPADFVSTLTPSTIVPGGKSYVVDAGAPYLDGSHDPAYSYIVVMGSAELELVDTWSIGGDFRIAAKTNGMSIPIDATLDLEGKARFSIGGAEGFQLLDIGLTEVSVFGIDVSALAGALPTFALPTASNASAALTSIVDAGDSLILEPFSGLKITGFSGGVEFFKSLPDAYYPEDLLDPEFIPTVSSGGAITAEARARNDRRRIRSVAIEAVGLIGCACR